VFDQPVVKIKEYFGHRLAFYFAFLCTSLCLRSHGFLTLGAAMYMKALLVPAVIGLLLSLYSCVRAHGAHAATDRPAG
jgi:hypothetical protein